jgi:hypothetical protein
MHTQTLRGFVVGTVLALLAAAPAAADPTVVRDVQTGMWKAGSAGTTSIPSGGDPIQDYTQPDTQIEPSIAVNPANPLNVVAGYQEGRIAGGGDATNGYSTSFDGGQTWVFGEFPKLTTFPGQGGQFERASDAVMAFGPGNTVYANHLLFDATTGGGLRSAIAVNVSKDGGRTWSDPVVFQDDQLGGTNDKNWIVVDNSDAPGHHKGRVYVVWDRVSPVVYNYCDHDCDQLSNWLPNLQKIPGLVFAGQGIGAYPMVMKSGGLGIVLDTLTNGAPTGTDEPEGQGNNHVFFSAPTAGSTPYPAPLAFAGPIQIADNGSKGVTAQRASDGLPASAVDPKSGAIYAVYDDGRFRTDDKNDAVFSKSSDEGQTWSAPARINPGSKTDKVNHYGVSVAVSEDGVVHIMYRQRDESAAAPLFTDVIDTYYQESRDGGKTWSAPLKVNTRESRPHYGAFSRDGTFEGDYDQVASSGGYSYVVREQGEMFAPDEPAPLVKSSATTIALTAAGKGHQHQRNWVALIRDLPPGSGATAPGGGSARSQSGGVTVVTPSGRGVPVLDGRPRVTLVSRCASRRGIRVRVKDPRGPERVVRAIISLNGHRLKTIRGRRLATRISLRGRRKGTFIVRITARTDRGRTITDIRRYHTCVPGRSKKRSKRAATNH